MAWDLLDQHHRVTEDAGFDPSYCEADARAALEADVGAGAGSEPAVNVHHTLVHGRAAPSLVEAAEGADLLVVGALGLGGFKSLLLGSVSQH